MSSEDDESARKIDETSLIQSLKDFEIANARVIDLTGRLVQVQRELLALRSELETVRTREADLAAELARLNAVLDDIRAGRVYAIARSAADARRALGRR